MASSLSRMKVLSSAVCVTSSATTGSSPRRTTSSGSKGNRGRWSSDTPPPADNVSFDPAQVGRRYGWVEVLTAERRYTRGWADVYVLCRCTGCGTAGWFNLSNLARGKSRGCQACSRRRRAPKWLERRCSAAAQRCRNPRAKQYASYGGRGIEFRFSSPTAMAEWVVENLGVERDKQLDRVDNDGHYEPGNLRWSTRKENIRNSRTVGPRRLTTSGTLALGTVLPQADGSFITAVTKEQLELLLQWQKPIT